MKVTAQSAIIECARRHFPNSAFTSPEMHDTLLKFGYIEPNRDEKYRMAKVQRTIYKMRYNGTLIHLGSSGQKPHLKLWKVAEDLTAQEVQESNKVMLAVSIGKFYYDFDEYGKALRSLPPTGYIKEVLYAPSKRQPARVLAAYLGVKAEKVDPRRYEFYHHFALEVRRNET